MPEIIEIGGMTGMGIEIDTGTMIAKGVGTRTGMGVDMIGIGNMIEIGTENMIGGWTIIKVGIKLMLIIKSFILN